MDQNKLYIVTYIAFHTGELMKYEYRSRHHAEQFARAIRHHSTGVGDSVRIRTETMKPA